MTSHEMFLNNYISPKEHVQNVI